MYAPAFGRCHAGLSEQDKAVVKFLSAISLSKETVDFYVALISTLKNSPEDLPSRESLEQLKDPRIGAPLLLLFPRRKPVAGKKNAPMPKKARNP